MHYQHDSGQNKATATMPAQLPAAMQEQVERLLASLVAIEKEEYSPEALVPFQQYADKLLLKGKEIFLEHYKHAKYAQKLLKDHFAEQERLHPEAHSDTPFSIWEEAQANMRKKMEVHALC